MFSIFKRNKVKLISTQGIWKEVAMKIEKSQRKWADFLGTKVQSWSKYKLKVFLLLFCLIGGSISCYVIVQSLRTQNSSVPLEEITLPAHVIEDTQQRHEMRPIISESENRRMEGFLAYMDSLKQDQMGKLLYDSIIHERPGLLDSIALVISIYKKQKK